MDFKSGFICIAGLANAGKSTLTNALVGEKVSIVSWRPQTTRNKLLGIINGDGYQMVLIDTPGIHKVRNHLGQYMMQAVENSLKDVDGVVSSTAQRVCKKRITSFWKRTRTKLP